MSKDGKLIVKGKLYKKSVNAESVIICEIIVAVFTRTRPGASRPSFEFRVFVFVARTPTQNRRITSIFDDKVARVDEWRKEERKRETKNREIVFRAVFAMYTYIRVLPFISDS